MIKTFSTVLLAIFAAAALLAQAPTAGEAKLAIAGDIPQTLTLTKDDLSKMPRTTVSWSEGGPKLNYEGVRLYDLLKRAGAPLDQQLSGKALASYVLAEARDGYQVVLSLAEIDPGLTENQILVADSADGQPLPANRGPLRLVVATDKKGARSVRMLERLTLVRLRK